MKNLLGLAFSVVVIACVVVAIKWKATTEQATTEQAPPVPKLKFGQSVVVVSGFFEGSRGQIQSCTSDPWYIGSSDEAPRKLFYKVEASKYETDGHGAMKFIGRVPESHWFEESELEADDREEFPAT